MFVVTGLISIAFGVVLSARPDIGAVTLALLFGLQLDFRRVGDRAGRPNAPDRAYRACNTARRRLSRGRSGDVQGAHLSSVH